MAITDIFKKEDGKQTKAEKSTKESKTKVLTGKSVPAKTVVKSGKEGLALEHAHITEKASKLAEINQYVFRVSDKANKQEISRAIESYYGVDVVGVNVTNMPGKRHRRGRGFAVRPGYRKAIVSIKKGQSIEILPK